MLDSDTFVAGFLVGQRRPLFAGPPSPVPDTGYSCAATVEVGSEVTLVAHPSPSFEFVRWRTSNAANRVDYCPCDGESDPTCHVSVDATLASHHDRVYCGAVYRPAPRPTAILAR